jgi:hypothetical protein
MFEKGNKLGAKGKLFDKTLRAAIAQEDGKRVREAAEKLLDSAAAGEEWAISLLADRLDGRAAQSIDIAGQVTVTERVSLVAAFLAALPAGGAVGVGEVVGEGRSLLPAEIPVTQDRH